MSRPPFRRDLVARTLWRVEARLSEPPSLASLAAAEGVGPFHLTRAFGVRAGRPLMAYVRARRLSEAARALRMGTSVTEAALAAGYDSPDGFGRAFRAAFGVAPSTLKTEPETPLVLQEPLIMTDTAIAAVAPRFAEQPSLRVVGRARRYAFSERARIPGQWGETAAEMGDRMRGVPTYGVCYDFADDAFTYLVGVADEGGFDASGLDRVTIPAGRYAVFDHPGDVSTISRTWEAALDGAGDGYAVADGPEFERYAPDLDPSTPGGVAIWLPLAEEGAAAAPWASQARA